MELTKQIKIKEQIFNLTLEEVVNKFQGLVNKLLKSWISTYELEDLQQIGNMGLIKAYKSYNINKGSAFITYATLYIQHEFCRQHSFSKHAEERMTEKNITKSDIFKIFKHYHIIEYHNKNGDLRVLLRGELKEETKCTCISMNLKTGKIITVYQNDYDDIHKTIKWEEYSKNIDIVKEFNTYIRNKFEDKEVI